MRLAALTCMALLMSAQDRAVFAQTPQPGPSTPSASSAPSASTAKLAASPIQTQFKAFKVIFLNGGKEELEPASSVSPGDVVEYVAVHRNVSAKRLLNTDFAIPIPHGTTLWQGSVQPASGVLKMPDATGQEEKAKAKGSDRARVVWRVDKLDPGQTVEFKLRVSIDPDRSLTPAPAPNPFRPVQPQLRRP